MNTGVVIAHSKRKGYQAVYGPTIYDAKVVLYEDYAWPTSLKRNVYHADDVSEPEQIRAYHQVMPFLRIMGYLDRERGRGNLFIHQCLNEEALAIDWSMLYVRVEPLYDNWRKKNNL